MFKYCRQLAVIGIVVIFLYLLFPRPAYAYIDLGAGSFIIQFLIAGLLGALYAAKVYWAKIKDFFNRSFHTSKRTTKGDD